ncbi:hypothetical protein OSB04_003817 [Centaurea solstitialis]|uniref:Uncharacterized protein n=1 Tax=Centaurea solstitialis TaxID=347529 RepID=A0AA38U623_9ASTR|nr:hypothetical protein OSB04_003817 [Centaurea solstitialis]
MDGVPLKILGDELEMEIRRNGNEEMHRSSAIVANAVGRRGTKSIKEDNGGQGSHDNEAIEGDFPTFPTKSHLTLQKSDDITRHGEYQGAMASKTPYKNVMARIITAEALLKPYRAMAHFFEH